MKIFTFKTIGLRYILAATVPLIISGCMPGDIEGNAYIVKGGGDIKPAAGQQLVLLPYESPDLLFEDLVERAVSEAMTSRQPEFVEECRRAVEAIPNGKNKLQERLRSIQERGAIPTGGCSGLASSLTDAETQAEADTKTLQDEVSVLREEKLDLRSVYDDLLQERAIELKQRAMSKVTARFQRRGGMSQEYFNLLVTNNSPYCILKENREYEVDLFQNTTNGKEIFNVTIPPFKFDEAKDRYGFEKGCVIESGKSQWANYLPAPQAGSRSMRLRVERDNIKTFATRYSGTLVSIDGANLTDLDFFSLSSREFEDRVIWRATPIDWEEEAKKDFPPEILQQISVLDSQISELDLQIAEMPSVQDASKLREAVDLCTSSQTELNLVEQKLERLNDAKSIVQRCNTKVNNLGDLRLMLTVVNQVADQSVRAPTLSVGSPNILVEFNKILADENVRKADVLMGGQFKFEGVPRGKYLIYGEYSDSFADALWLFPVQVGMDGIVELNNQNSIDANGILEALDCNTCSFEMGVFDYDEIAIDGDEIAIDGDEIAIDGEEIAIDGEDQTWDPECFQQAGRIYDTCRELGNSEALCNGNRRINEKKCKF